MPKNAIGRTETCAPLYGNNMGYFSVGDLPSHDPSPLTALTAVVSATTSAAQATACRDIEIVVEFGTAGATCDIIVYRVDPGPTDTQILSVLGVNHASPSIYVGGFEGLTLDGRDCKVRAENISAGSVTVKIKRK